jgi:hypothetical protein
VQDRVEAASAVGPLGELRVPRRLAGAPEEDQRAGDRAPRRVDHPAGGLRDAAAAGQPDRDHAG